MDQVRSKVLEEGRDAKNLFAFHIFINDDSKIGNKVCDKPPSANVLKIIDKVKGAPELKSKPKLAINSKKGSSHVRSVSVGRDKRSELRARYWSLLFGNLKRSMEEIYTTVELHENLAECQEVTLVLENYIRDFNALAQWLRLKWEYENTPARERPTSVAWDISKTSSRRSSCSGSSGKISPNTSDKVAISKSESNIREDDVTGPETNSSPSNFDLAPSGDLKFHKNVTKRNVSVSEIGVNTDAVDDTVDMASVTSDQSVTVLVTSEKLPKVDGQCQTDIAFDGCLVMDINEGDKVMEIKSKLDNCISLEKVTEQQKPKVLEKEVKKPEIKPAYSAALTKNMKSSTSTSTSTSNRTSLTNVTKLRLNTPRVLNRSKTMELNRRIVPNKSQNISISSSKKHFTKKETETIRKVNEKVTVDVDGWSTVKCKSKFRQGRRSDSGINWKNRFNEVSATTSLPTLSQLRETTQENLKTKSSIVAKCDIKKDDKSRQKTEKLNKEEESLQKQIAALQSTDILDIDTEDTDEIFTSATDDEVNQLSLEDRYEPMLSNLSLPERLNALSALETMEARYPGRALKLHRKLSSPSRKKLLLVDVMKQYEAKQERAGNKRQALLQEKANKLQSLWSRVEEVKLAKTHIMEEKRRTIEQKLERATENRNQHLKKIVKKAHTEEEKMKEIAFINQLEAENKKFDFLTQCREEKKRLQELIEDRRKKQKEKAAKEAKIEQRKKDLEREKTERLNRLKNERRQKDERIEKQQQQREKERQELAREKARDREERISAIQAQHLENVQKLQKRISQKQEDSTRRHEENIEQIRQKALELSILRCHVDDGEAPTNIPYPKMKFCKVCNITINSEVYLLSHLRGKKHQEIAKKSINEISPKTDEIGQFNLKQIIDCPNDTIDPKIIIAKERGKVYKKRFKKIRQRLALRGAEFEAKAEHKYLETEQQRVVVRIVNSISSLINQSIQGFSPNTNLSLERKMNELIKLLNTYEREIHNFRIAGGFNVLGKLLNLSNGSFENSLISQKALVIICSLWKMACCKNTMGIENCKHIIESNRISALLQILYNRLQDNYIHEETKLPSDIILPKLMELISLILNNLPSDTSQCQLQDVISYAVSVGIVERLSQYCICVHGSLDNDVNTHEFLLSTLDFLASLASKCPTSSNGDPTLLISALHSTELLGIISMLYSTLLLPSKTTTLPNELLRQNLILANSTFRLLARIAELDLYKFQEALGAEGTSLQFRHIASYLLSLCSQLNEPDVKTRRQLLHEVIQVVGYFAVNNKDNQMLLVSGYAPSVLQQLCTLPFPYFSVDYLSSILYPTLLACCCNNVDSTKIINNELTYKTLEDFRNSETGKSIKLVQLLPKPSS